MISNFDKAILGIAQAYGPYKFWPENLNPEANPDATWRAMLVAAALKDKDVMSEVPRLLRSTDSRVRAWTCYYLVAVAEESSTNQLLNMTRDPSPRVRYQARQALSRLHLNGKLELPPMQPDVHKGLTVLISEDNQRSRENIASLLNENGFFTYMAETEKDTVSMAIQYKPKVIVTDNQKVRDNLSGLNMTWDLCRNPNLRETILFMLSSDEAEPIFIWSGGDFFFNKRRFMGEKFAEAFLDYLR